MYNIQSFLMSQSPYPAIPRPSPPTHPQKRHISTTKIGMNKRKLGGWKGTKNGAFRTPNCPFWARGAGAKNASTAPIVWPVSHQPAGGFQTCLDGWNKHLIGVLLIPNTPFSGHFSGTLFSLFFLPHTYPLSELYTHSPIASQGFASILLCAR